MLWDIGTGSGSIAIEWMRAHPANRAIAIDRRPDRLDAARDNAATLGVPGLHFIEGDAPAALEGLAPPDAVFIGGGAQIPGVVDTAWEALRRGGRMVINAVTIETDAVLFAALRDHGGSLTRIGVERLAAVGTMHGYRPSMTITQWQATKPW
jgi:precorrin-6Y C5,15-methyltransferase (decarboxylating)